MKPNEIDSLVKSKLQEDIDLYDREISESKPFIWTSIRHKIKRNNLISWRRLVAAAVVLFLLGLSFVFYLSQRKQQVNLDLLANKINQLEKTNQSGTLTLRAREAQIATLENELRLVNTQLTHLAKETKLAEPVVRYQTDTIYIKRTEPVKTASMVLVNTKSEQLDKQVSQNQALIVKSSEVKIDEMIYPDFSNQKFKPPAETSKVKFGTFTARKD